MTPQRVPLFRLRIAQPHPRLSLCTCPGGRRGGGRSSAERGRCGKGGGERAANLQSLNQQLLGLCKVTVTTSRRLTATDSEGTRSFMSTTDISEPNGAGSGVGVFPKSPGVSFSACVAGADRAQSLPRSQSRSHPAKRLTPPGCPQPIDCPLPKFPS